MSMQSISDILFLLYRAGVPAMLEGVHGIGKTSLCYQLHSRVIKELGKEKNIPPSSVDTSMLSTLDARKAVVLSKVGTDEFGLWSCSAANVTVEEFIGYPQPQDGVISYLRSHNFIPPPDHRGGGIWNVDELNLGFQEVEKAVMSIALEGRYLDYVLPDGVFVITSQNPSAGEYQSRKLNPPTLNRFCYLRAEALPDEVLNHFMAKEFHPSIIDCLTEHSATALNPHQDKVEFENHQVPTSRSWEMVNRVMKVATEKEIAEHGLTVFSGLLGPTTASVYFKFAQEKGERSIPIDEVLTSYGYDEKTYDPDNSSYDKWPVTPLRKKIQAMVKRKTVRVDIINLALNVLVERLGKMATEVEERHKKASGGSVYKNMAPEHRAALANIMVFLHDLPSDQAGPAFLRKIQGKAYDFTLRPFARDKIACDYTDSWSHLQKEVNKEAS